MNRDLLPNMFHIKTRKCKDKNRAIVKILLEFGIYVHNEEHSKEESLNTYNRCFNENHIITVEGNYLVGNEEPRHNRLTVPNLLKAFGES